MHVCACVCLNDSFIHFFRQSHFIAVHRFLGMILTLVSAWCKNYRVNENACNIVMFLEIIEENQTCYRETRSMDYSKKILCSAFYKGLLHISMSAVWKMWTAGILFILLCRATRKKIVITRVDSLAAEFVVKTFVSCWFWTWTVWLADVIMTVPKD